jgi:hypothetical protein
MFVDVYCCEFSDTSSDTDTEEPLRHELNGGEAQSIASTFSPEIKGTYVAFTTHAPQLHAKAHSPQLS